MSNLYRTQYNFFLNVRLYTVPWRAGRMQPHQLNPTDNKVVKGQCGNLFEVLRYISRTDTGFVASAEENINQSV